jgi:hypothetical protein
MNPPPVYIPIDQDRIDQFTELAAKTGARIHVIRQVPVDQGCDWNTAISLVGPHTPFNHCIREVRVGCQYQCVSSRKEETDIVLLNYCQVKGSFNRSIDWCKDAGLNAANPREVFAIGHQRPNLDRIIGQDLIYLAAPVKCSFNRYDCACFVWWIHQELGVSLDRVVEFSDPYVWFAFREPRTKPVR